MTFEETRQLLETTVLSKDGCLKFIFDFKNLNSGNITITDTCAGLTLNADFVIVKESEIDVVIIRRIDFDLIGEHPNSNYISVPLNNIVNYLSTELISYKSL